MDTRRLQYFRYTATSPEPFKDVWR
jgi:hypothetical protein